MNWYHWIGALGVFHVLLADGRHLCFGRGAGLALVSRPAVELVAASLQARGTLVSTATFGDELETAFSALWDGTLSLDDGTGTPTGRQRARRWLADVLHLVNGDNLRPVVPWRRRLRTWRPGLGAPRVRCRTWQPCMGAGCTRARAA